MANISFHRHSLSVATNRVVNQKEANMERTYGKSDEAVVELGVASKVTNGQGQRLTDSPQGQSAAGILDD
ncbi:MAG: hypothetical protein DI606_10060 [Sphingobium sp.]|uniref:Benenodin family lasso peptide n=1 Tax=Sphingobium terrigena TaxID=2304063 RepID=A0A418YQ82_9SPHN|nr:MAG: hypothetical protein DI606_10060 [Sphingobium sp.]RJG53637.1 hypothetical protein D0Z70_15415 [Sphingobium terrigena]